MKSVAKISWGQILILLLICRIFTLMTFVPLISDGYNFPTQIIASVIATVIQAIAVIPLILFSKAYPEQTVTAAVMKKNKFWGYIVSIVYLLFFLTYTINSVLHFIKFLNDRFFPESNVTIMMIILLAVGVYCAHCGIEGISRSSVIVFVLFIIMLFIMVITASQNFSMINYYAADYDDNLFNAVMEDLSRNSEIVVAAFVVKNIKSCFKCSIYGFLASKLIITELITMLIIGVLGDFAKLTDYPFMTVGSYAGTELFQRNDSLYLILWTIIAVINISLFMYISAGLTEEIIPKIKLKSTIIAAIVFLAALPFVIGEIDFALIRDYTCGGVMSIILIGIIPLILYMTKKGNKEHEKKN